MKILKKISIGLLSFLLFTSIYACTLSFSIKALISEGVINDLLMKKVSEGMSSSLNVSNEDMEKVMDNQAVKDLMSTYIDRTVDGVIDDSSIDEAEIGKELVDYIKTHKSEIEGQLGVTIDDSKLDDVLESEEYKSINNNYKQAVKSANKNMSKSDKNILKMYKFLVSNKFKNITIAIALVLLVLIAVLQKSLYMWIRKLGSSIFISGIFNVIAGFVVGKIVKSAISENEIIDSFTTDSVIRIGINTCIIGAIIFIIYEVIKFIVSKKKGNSKKEDDSLELDDEEDKEDNSTLE